MAVFMRPGYHKGAFKIKLRSGYVEASPFRFILMMEEAS